MERSEATGDKHSNDLTMFNLPRYISKKLNNIYNLRSEAMST